MHRQQTLISHLPLLFLLAGLLGLLTGLVARHPFSGMMGWLLMLNGGLLQIGAAVNQARSRP